jgi:glycosyltransferase involved in cell wall biosynthesis
MLRLAPFRAAALRCDHIHAHFATEAADMARLLAASTGRPWSFTAHASDAYSHPDRLAVNLKSAKFARAASPHVATQLRKASPDSQIVEIPVAVALDRFERTTPYLATGPIVSTGRLVEKKGFDDLINAFATARLDDRELWIIGEGPLRPDLEGRAEGLNVRFLGALDPDSVSDALRDASAFALLSKVASDGDRDGRPVAIVEAMAAGLPIISTRLPGIEDLVDRGCGLLVEPANAVSAAVAIRELMHMDPEQRGAMGRHGQLRTKAFAPELVAARLRALFAE